MSFKKLPPQVTHALANVDITNVSEFGNKLFSAMKSGSHVLAIASKNAGKTQTAIVASFDKVNQQMEGAPRVLYVCSSIEESMRVYEIMKKVAHPLDVTVDLVHDKGSQVQQRNDLFNGTEIIIGTIKRVFELYVQNGINLTLLDYLIIDDLEDVLTQGKVMEIKRIIDGLNKARFIGLANQKTQRINQFVESIPVDLRMLENQIG
jgi:superfamily II DNA/RNA helicase